MDKFIKELLLKYAKVILPDFGAIVFDNEEEGTLMFNEHLNYDDGKLVKLLVDSSNMDEQEARNSLSKFIRDLRHRLDKGETYNIYQLGEFSKSEDESYVFKGNIDSDNQINSVPNPPASESISEQNTNLSSFTSMLTQQDEPKYETPKEEAPKEEEETFIPPVEEVPQVSEEVKEEIPVTPPPVQKSKEVTPTIEKKEEEVKETPTTVVKEPKEKKKRGFGFWFLILLCCAVLVTSVYAAFNYDKIANILGWEREEVQESEELIEEENEELIIEADEDAQEIEEEIMGEEYEEEVYEEEVVEESSPEPVVASGNYHIIIGGFGERENAENLVQELREKGLNAQIIEGNGSLIKVSAQNYATQKEAQENLSVIEEKTGVLGWILKQ